LRSKRILLQAFILVAVTVLVAPYGQSETGAAELLLRWSDNSDDEQGFKIERKSGTTGTFGQIASVGPNITAYTDSGLTAGSTYCYRLLAFNGSGSSPYSETACSTISSTFTLAVSKTGTGTGTVTSAPAGINCGSTCSASFSSGAFVTLTAAPTTGSTFSGWSGTGCTTGTVTMTGNITCTATFKGANNPMLSKIGIFRPETGEWFLDRNGNRQWDGCSVDLCLNSYGYPGDLPVVGIWIPNGANSIGVFDSSKGRWELDTNGNGVWDGCAVDICISSFGDVGDLPVTRRVNGSSQSMLGVFTSQLTYKLKRRTVTQEGLWQFDVNGNQILDGCSANGCNQYFGSEADLPVVGDWNGTGTDEIGVFQPSTGQWLLDTNGNGKWDNCRKDRCLGPFGLPDDLPVVGDWDGTQNTRIGIFRPSTGAWFLDLNGNGEWDGCAVDACIESFGQPGDLPVTGRW
jgi:hypothetical protein